MLTITLTASFLALNVIVAGISFLAHRKCDKQIDSSLRKIEDNAKQWDVMAEKHGFDWR